MQKSGEEESRKNKNLDTIPLRQEMLDVLEKYLKNQLAGMKWAIGKEVIYEMRQVASQCTHGNNFGFFEMIRKIAGILENKWYGIWLIFNDIIPFGV